MRLSYFGAEGRTQVFETAAPHLTIGSGVACDLRMEGLAPLECTIYLSEQGYYATDDGGSLSIEGIQGPGFLQPGHVLQLDDAIAFRFDLVPDTPAPPVASSRSPAEPVPGRSSAASVRRPAGMAGERGRSPKVAAVLSTLFPGAGQAYNGQPLKAFLILLLAVLVVPWLLGIWDAYRVADQSMVQGARRGGGPWGVLLHLWLFVDLALLALLALTLTGVLT